MRTSKDVFTECLPELIIDEEKLRAMQNRLLLALVDIHNVCEKYNLTYFLDGGTLIGAVRHKGFIPWDDDIDIMMPLDDYNKLGECIEKEFGDKYIVRYPRTDVKDTTSCMKVYIKDTTYKEILSAEWEKPQMLFIDVLAIRSMSKSKLIRNIKWRVVDIAMHCANLKNEYKCPSKFLAEKCKENDTLRKYMKARRRFGRVANMLSIKCWFAIIDKMFKKEYQDGLVETPEGVRFKKKAVDKSLLDSSVDVEFEGQLFKAPIGWDKYLSHRYGDYMEIPQEDKRERHVALEIEF